MRDVKIIDVNKGYEDRFLIETRLNDKSKFFYNAYKRSAEIINEICSFDRSVMSEKELSGNYCPNNIIIYCAERGGGKTTAMLSVANSLKHISDNNGISCMLKAQTKECKFSVIPPIDPTSIAADESFMRIVLSRLFSKLRDKWNDEDDRNSSSGNMGMMYDRAEVVEKFTECYKLLNAIDAMYKKKDVYSNSDLENLTELGDFSKLKSKFMDLVNCYLKHMHGDRKSYLVLLVDDADLNAQKSFEIIEDIRKYCILPNIIILMAANMEQMHQVIEQHYIIEFKPFFDFSGKIVDSTLSESQKPLSMTVRYLNKVFPATHQIHLPVISDFVLYNSSRLGIKYTELPLSGSPDKLSYPSQDYQERLINLIHKKTGVGFVKPDRYLHNFIPGNMRDLTHFLSYFNALPDLEDYGYADFYVSVRNGGEDPKIQDEIEKRLSNLDALQVYFIHNWCDKTLTQENCQIINKLAATAEPLKISTAVNIVSDYMSKNLDIQDTDQQSVEIRYSYANLMRLISLVSENAKSQNDFMQIYKLVFALRLLFTIFLHRKMLNGIIDASFDWLYSITGGILWHFDYGKMFGGHKDFGHFEVSVQALKKLYDIPDSWEEAKLSPNLKNLMKELSECCYMTENGEYKRFDICTDPKDIKPIDDKTIYFDTSASLLTFLTSPELYSSSSGQLACLNHLYDVLLNWEMFHQITKYAERTEITETNQYDPAAWHSALINLLCGKYNKLPKYYPSKTSLLNMPYLENQLPDANTKLDLSVNINILYANKNNAESVIKGLFNQMKIAVDDINTTADPSDNAYTASTSALQLLNDCIAKLISMENLTGSISEIEDLHRKYINVNRYNITALRNRTRQFRRNISNDSIDSILDGPLNTSSSNPKDALLSAFTSSLTNKRDSKSNVDTFMTRQKNAEKALHDKINSQEVLDKIMNGLNQTFGIVNAKSPSASNKARNEKPSARSKESEPDRIGAKTDENAKKPSEDSVQPDTAGTPSKHSKGTK